MSSSSGRGPGSRPRGMRRAGLSVALIERQEDGAGGTCVNRGCVPTKGLIQAAEVMDSLKFSDRFRLTVKRDAIRPDVKRISLRSCASGASATRLASRAGSRGPSRRRGGCRFVGERLLKIDDDRRLTADSVFICAGARPFIPPIPGIEDIPMMTNTEVLELEAAPERLVILGGGCIGVESGPSSR